MSEYIPSPEDVDFCVQVETTETLGRLAVGDLVNLRAEQHGISQYEVAKVLASSSGGNQNTYYDSSRVAAIIPPDVREEYPLSFHQYRACLSGAEPLEVVRWAVEDYPDAHGGKPATVQAIYEYTLGKRSDSRSILYRNYAYLSRRLAQVAADDRMPEPFRVLAVEMGTRLEIIYQEVRGE